MSTGLFTMVVPFIAGFGAAGTVVAVLVGSIVTGVSLKATPDERGLTAIPVTTLHAFDWGTVLGLYGAALVLAIASDPVAALTLAAIATVQMAGNLTTRYSLRA
jgi:hypothetical protein